MWRKPAHTSSSEKLCLTKIKFKWTDVDNNTFIDMKKILGYEVVLYYPNFSEIFITHTDARNMHIGGAITQNRKLIAFYSRNLPPEQINNTTT